MRAFHTIAIPHSDILEGKLTMDIFAADLWEVYKGRAPDEYQDASQFERKTYHTEGLQNILSIVEKRISGRGGDPVIQLQTPFGGGKTHALIAMYHHAAKWKAKPVVLVGTAMSPQDTLWGLLEQQLTGKTAVLTRQVAPGREAIYSLLKANQPVVILMDEVLEYVTKAAGVKVEKSTLSAQTIAFMQELTEVVGTLENVCLIVTLPSSILEHYDEKSEQLFQQLQKVAGRVEKIYTPVQENEISHVIRQRLFSQVDEKAADENIQEFMDYANRESLLPSGVEPSEYRKRFQAAYPFLPEVIDILYHRWGSYSSFQRTRGVLRLLSLVVHDLKAKDISYISLADFNLSNQEIRRELLKHIGPQFDSVIGSDITDATAGAKHIDTELGKAYQGLSLGTRAANTIFMHSFSGGPERGAGLGEIKRSATTVQNPSSVVAEAVEKLKSKLFYLQHHNEKYFFTNQPNLNRILCTKMDNVERSEILEQEKALLKGSVSGHRFKVYIWPQESSDIPDDQNLKLIIMAEKSNSMEEIFHKKATMPRVNKNTLIFLMPSEAEQRGFHNIICKYLAYKLIMDDKTLNLSAEQKKEVNEEIKKLQEDLGQQLRRYYRYVYIPTKSGFKKMDLGIPTYGELKRIDDDVYEKLRAEGEILENIAPLVIKEKYLKDKYYVSTEQLYKASLTSPGETRVVDKSVWGASIAEGVNQGQFGLGELQAKEAICRYYKERPSVAFIENEILVSEDICKQQKEKPPVYRPPIEEEQGKKPEVEIVEGISDGQVRYSLQMKFTLPKGKVADLMGVLNFLQSKFNKLELELGAKDGQISEREYEDKIKEAFRQMGIEVHE